MIEVIPQGNRWVWTMIGFCGRVLVYGRDSFATDIEAFAAAKAWRSEFWARADQIDHRMARAI